MLTRLAVLLLMTSQFFPRTVADPSGRYYGVKQVGADPYGYQSLELTLTAKATTATMIWVRRDETDERERKELTLTDLKIDTHGLSATVKGARPAGIPATWKGKFMTKAPPANAKGPVQEGLLLDGDWFLEVTAP
ncbi:MAG: hypothetical protein QM817_33750 [Archangium sp.]